MYLWTNLQPAQIYRAIFCDLQKCYADIAWIPRYLNTIAHICAYGLVVVSSS